MFVHVEWSVANTQASNVVSMDAYMLLSCYSKHLCANDSFYIMIVFPAVAASRWAMLLSCYSGPV